MILSSAQADENGLRRDVLAALRELNFRSMRYPGGNFLSGYRWEDGIGPQAQRPRRRELAWQSIETNQFGTDEFLHFCREINTEPMLGVNMGTGDIQDAANLVEYCNAPTGSQYADKRAANGNADPWGVTYWCLGNEMDGPWQIGHLNAVDYGKKAREAAKLMRWHDDTISLVLCGSSGPAMPSYPEWDRVALELCWDQVDYHSMHYYAANVEDDTPSFLAISAHSGRICRLAGWRPALCQSQDPLQARCLLVLGRVGMSGTRARGTSHTRGNWTAAPHLIEEVYNLEDALVVAQWLNVFLRKADVLKIACLAQIVNVIAPLLTRGDALLKQSIYYPLLHFSRLAKGDSLDVLVESPRYETAQFGDMPLLDVASGHDTETGTNSIFLVNRSLRDDLPLEIHWQDPAPRAFPRRASTRWQRSQSAQ